MPGLVKLAMLTFAAALAAPAVTVVGSAASAQVLAQARNSGGTRAQRSVPVRRNFRRLPPPVHLSIPNFRQKTDVWCWAAVAQQVIHKKRGKSPPQCALVAMVHGRYPSFCCPNYERCTVPGTLNQIRTLIKNFGHRYSTVLPPTDPMVLYRQLRRGRPIILAIRNTAYSGHVVVLAGMHWERTANGAEAILHINDPIRAIPARLPFRAILPRWHAAIVVY